MDEPYRNEFHAIKRAFSTHDRALMSSPKFYYEIPSGYPDVTKFLNDDGLCKLDRLVQDAYTQNFLCKTLSKEAFAILSAKYNQDAEEKLNHAIYISQSIQTEVHKNKRLTDQPKYRAWCVLKWCAHPISYILGRYDVTDNRQSPAQSFLCVCILLDQYALVVLAGVV